MKDKKILIRFEDKQGIGVYSAACCRVVHKWVGEEHPGPYEDNKLYNKRKVWKDDLRSYYFAFSSKTAARKWFHRVAWLRIMNARGVVVSEYVCNRKDVVLGSKQAIFCSHESKQSFNILSYFNIK